ncbi:MAG: hypothetical protein IJS15_15200, partial [Victivallales bacterium]|nr:hypothetical protein [Victivallales bacterium]
LLRKIFFWDRHFFKHTCVIACVASLLWCSGCIRITRELHPEAPYLKPRDKVFSGCHEFAHSLLFIPPFYWPEVVLEVLADVVFLPIDGVRCAYYAYNPPLGQIVQDNDLENLKKRLEKGENPNQIDMRFSKEPPITFAHSLDAVQLLCEHGAKVTPNYLSRCLWLDKSILRYITQNHLCQEMLSPSHINAYNNAFVERAVLASFKDCNRNESFFQNGYEKVSMLLQSGFSPNTVEDYQYRCTALDWTQKSVSLRPSEKEALVKLLRQYGAVTYFEAARQSSAFPRFKADNYALNPIFTRAERFLYESRNTKSFVVSTTYPGISGPVLVIDRLPWDHYHADNTNNTTRTTVMVHRRETPAAWRQEAEPLEIPVACRMVLTPPGTKIPSRVKGKYLQNIISEQWYSMEDFEVYEEINFQKYESNRYRINELRALTRTQLPFVNTLMDIPKPLEPYRLAENVWLCSQVWPFYPDTDIDKNNASGAWHDYGRAFLQRARETFEREQFAGRWFFMEDFHSYCFSTHRSAIPEKVKDIVPHPSEILVKIMTDNVFVDRDARYVYDNSHQDLAYWNWLRRDICKKDSVRDICKKGSVIILYGDDVSEERLRQIEALAVGLIEYEQR